MNIQDVLQQIKDLAEYNGSRFISIRSWNKEFIHVRVVLHEVNFFTVTIPVNKLELTQS
jgi:hypothetical protein